MHRETVEIKHTFTYTELNELGERLAREVQIVYNLKAEKTQAIADYTAQIKAAEMVVSQLVLERNQGWGFREVECFVKLESPRPGMAELIRVDNGEVVRERAMTPAEMQGGFDFPDTESETPQ